MPFAALNLIAILPPWAWQIIIAVLRETGAINWAEALSARVIGDIARSLKKVQTFHAKSDFPNPFPEHTNMPNFVTGQKLEPK